MPLHTGGIVSPLGTAERGPYELNNLRPAKPPFGIRRTSGAAQKRREKGIRQS